MKVDKTLLCQNIKLLIQEAKKKTGDIEAQGGMAPGYLSKLLKDESKNNNILDFVVTVASILGVTVESLVYTNYSELTPTERYFADFIDKILKETIEGKLVWERESTDFFKDFNNRAHHPLFDVSLRCSETYEPREFSYNSLFSNSVTVDCDCYNVKINGNYLYLMNVSTETDPFAYELYFTNSKDSDDENLKVTKICQVLSNTALSNIVGNLSIAAAESAKHMQVEESAREIIDNFMNK